MISDQRDRGRPTGPLLEWGVSRLLLLMLVFRLVTLPVSDGNAEEVALYHKWLEVFQSGSFPVGDETWQYPPGMSLALLAPVLLPVLTYQHAFYVTAFLVDAAVFAALWRTGRQPGRSMMGAWVWTIGVPLLGSMPYARLDMTVTGICVAALLWLPTVPESGRPGRRRGHHEAVARARTVGVGPGGTMRTVWARALGAAVALTLMLAAVLPGAWSFLSGQRARGLQIESFGALPFHVARHFGWPGQVELAYGAMQFTGPYAELVAYALPALSVFALGGLVLLRWHLPRSFFTGAAPSVLGLAAVLVCIFTSRVFSPQFMLWAVGLLAVGTTWRSSGLRTTARLVLAACGFTLVIYPFTYFDVMASTWSAIITLAVRDALLVTAAVHLLRTLRTAARAAGDQSAEASGLVPRPQSAEETDEVVATR